MLAAQRGMCRGPVIVCHMSVFCRNPAGFLRWCFLQPILHCVLGKFWYLQKLGYFPLEPSSKQSWQYRYLDLRFLKDIQMDCLWQTICILERQLLVTITQGQHSSYSLSSSRNSDDSCHLEVWIFHENAPVHKSLVAQQALYNCEFVQLNHPAYSLDLAPVIIS